MKSVKRTLIAAGLVLGVASTASAFTIDDNYIGKGTNLNGVQLGDVYGSSDRFNVFGMDVKNDASNLYVTVYTNFFFDSNIDSYDYGDLFISTDGWNPFGSEPYLNDDFSNGEKWEYAAVTDNGKVIDLNGADLTLSDELFGQSGSRENQEVLYKSGGSEVGSAVVDLADAGVSISYVLSLSDLGLDPFMPTEIGLRWAMTCANDTIEGSFVVPEPGSLALLGMGLLGLGLSRRRKS